jgi:hypothetical protein
VCGYLSADALTIGMATLLVISGHRAAGDLYLVTTSDAGTECYSVCAVTPNPGLPP